MGAQANQSGTKSKLSKKAGDETKELKLINRKLIIHCRLNMKEASPKTLQPLSHFPTR